MMYDLNANLNLKTKHNAEMEKEKKRNIYTELVFAQHY